MERLTKRGNDNVVRYKKDGLFLEPCEIPSYGDIKTILDRLAYYEDMEEQGRLVLPCKPGDKVYRVVRWGKNKVSIRERIISTVEYVGEGIWVIHSTGDDVLGKKCFLTRELAEQALKGGAENA